MRNKMLSVLLIIVFLLSLAGCSSTNTPATKTAESKTLKVVAAYGNKEQIFDAFTKDTGIKVEFLDMSSGEVLARAEAEGGKPMADVWFGGGLDSFIAAKNKGILEKYESKELAAIPAEYRDKDSYWYGVSLVLVGFMTNTEILKQKGLPAPKTWTDLKDSKYKGEVLIANPSISGTNYAMLSCILQTKGQEEGWKYFTELSRNVPFFSKRGGEPPTKVAAGEAAIGVIPVSGEFFALKSKAPVELYFPEDGIPWVPAGLSIFKNAQNAANAKVFVDWALSAKGQKIICEADPRVMVRADIPVPALMKDFAKEKLMKVDLEIFGTERKATLDAWDSKIGKKQ
ncbi:Iron deficiency-induced protein A precursor [Sporomusa ovata DSM 2662]|uniref:Ferric iron ABC transporter, iron-binding protein n=1 Tax=Sporomusa ovata TaxID=2378 RepID=A0A0U1KX84_9FIRM|nr:ABC transporter substrate-binding protein [Sporomusa ovata]EQB28192.1 ABC transporter [Sporomusa ovata DSM 2662]CQR71729.1 Ferric iron ABC transporter, iron-binding protein [Sporomusa ovata]